MFSLALFGTPNVIFVTLEFGEVFWLDFVGDWEDDFFSKEYDLIFISIFPDLGSIISLEN